MQQHNIQSGGFRLLVAQFFQMKKKKSTFHFGFVGDILQLWSSTAKAHGSRSTRRPFMTGRLRRRDRRISSPDKHL